jgi:hypothetical protein
MTIEWHVDSAPEHVVFWVLVFVYLCVFTGGMLTLARWAVCGATRVRHRSSRD